MIKGEYGLALDIGTSKIEAVLVSLESGRELAFGAARNSQFAFGADVMTRLNFAQSGGGGLKRLKERALGDIDALIDALAAEAGLGRGGISKILCVGNSAMHHLVLGISPDGLGRAPFRPSNIGRPFVSKARLVGLKGPESADFEFLPNIGGFVGSDALAVIVSSGAYKSKTPVLAIDIGTNGEVILGKRDRMLVASTSAGPAFEGWGVRCGMPAVTGAIESVKTLRGKITSKTIGGVRPKGICGSGLLDALKVMLEKRVLAPSGRLKKGAFKIHGGISVTQEDVRQLQLAKAAMRACVDILRTKFKNRIEKVFITGRFGNYLSAESAKAVGIIPEDISLKKIRFLKHGALEGAKAILCSDSLKKTMLDFQKKITHVELHKEGSFQDEFVRALGF